MNAKAIGALCLLLGLCVCVPRSWARYEEQLIKAFGSPHVFWVDRYGIRHHVPTPELRDQYFAGRRTLAIARDDLDSMPQGHSVTNRMPPVFYDSVDHPELGRPGRLVRGYGGFVAAGNP